MRYLSLCASCLALLVISGCSHDNGWHGGGSPDMETRLYHVRSPDADSAIVSEVLDREYRESGVRSSSSLTPAGDIMVQTTPRGHAAVRRALGADIR